MLVHLICGWSYPTLSGLPDEEKIWNFFPTQTFPQYDPNAILCQNTDTLFWSRPWLYQLCVGWLANHVVVQQSSCVDTSQQKVVVERKTRHLLEVARSLVFTSHVHFLGEAVLTATYLINWMPSRVLQFKTLVNSLLASFKYTSFSFSSAQGLWLLRRCSHPFLPP